MKPSKPLPFKKRPLTTAIQAVCYSMLGALPLANAGLVDGRIVDGSGTITQSGLTTTVDQASQRLGMTAQSLNLTVNELLKFNQPNTSAIALLRILGNDGSTIAGRIDANGKVILANPNGIFFTSTATLNVGSIVASGLDISSADFMNGNYIFNEIAGTNGTVINSGTINASLGGSVALIGKRVENNGLITATLGSVTLAAGKQAVLTFDQGGLLGVRVSKEILQSELGVDPAVLNSGTINASGGKVLLTASVSKDIFSQAVNTQGLQQATSVVVNDDGSFSLGSGADVLNTGSIDTSTTAADQNIGRIVLIGENVTSSGVLRADATTGNGGEIELHSSDTTLLTQNSVTSARAETNGNGGLIKVLGDKVGLFDQATVDVSGANSGGQALIGGDREGKNTAIRNANYIYLSEQSQVKADGLNTGNGGKIITFAKDTARIYGNLSARGGVNGGNGGFIETSGLRGFEILNAPDMGATNGVGGLWLIDPYNLEISNSNCSNVTCSPLPQNFSPSGATAILRDNIINDALANGSVEISTVCATNDTACSSNAQQGNIRLTNSAEIDFDDSGLKTLTLTAAGNITFEAGSRIRDSNTTNNNYLDKLNVTLNAGGVIELRPAGVDGQGNAQNAASITTQGGNFTVGSTTSRVASFTNNGSVNTSGNGNQNGGNISIYTTGNVSSTVLTADGGAAIRTVSNQGAPGLNGGDVTVDAGGSVLLGSISSRGSNGNFDNNDNSGENGGVGGTVNIVTTSASGITVNGTINTSGGNGSGDNDTGNGADPGSGGNAGSISAQANNGAVALGAITANGGTAIGAGGTPRGGNGAPVSVTGTSVLLNGDIQANGGTAEPGSRTVTQGNGANITLTGPVTLGANATLAASGASATHGDISFSSTLNGPFDLGLTGRDVTFRGAVGNTDRLDALTIVATRDVTAATNATTPVPNAITANSIAVTQSSSFTSGAITTSSASAAGGPVTIASAGAVNTGAITTTGSLNGGLVTVSQSGSFTSGNINTSSTTAAGGAVNITSSGAVNVGDIITAGSTTAGTANGGAITVQATQITLNGNIDASNAGGTTSQTANLTLTSPGSVFINYVNNITSPINLMVSGATGTHILNAANRANSWEITGNNSGSLNTGITFAGFETLNGNAGNDSFTFNVDSSSITTLINAGGQVSPTGDTVGFATGVTTVNVFLDRFTGIEGITGTNDGTAGNGLGNPSTLTGANTPNNDWDITGTNSGTYNTNLIFSGFNNLTGGNAGNTFTLAPNSTLPGTGVVTGTITGGGAAGNTLVARQGVANVWNFATTTSGSLAQAGTPAPVTYVNNFTNIQNFTGGGTGSDWADFSSSTNLNVNAGSYTGFAGLIGNTTSTLTGGNGQTNNWNIRAVVDQSNATTDGLNDGVVTGGASPQLRFVNFGTLTGGDSVDNFVIDASGSMNGTINGGTGANTLTAKDIRNTWAINSTASTLIYGGLNTTQPLAATTTFNAIQTLTGGSDVDTITVAGSTNAVIDTAGGVTNNVTVNAGVVLTGTINGGTGADTITVNGTLTGSLNAGAGIDRIVLGAAGNVSGVIDGSADADTLDIRARPATTVQIGTIQTLNLDVNQVETINANALAANTLRGDAGDNTWLISSQNNGSVAGISFTGFQNLTGGDGLDTFTVNASIANIDTGNGATNSVTVNSAGRADTITGGTGVDTITLLSGSTVTTINGGDNADVFDISGTVGIVNGGIGNDVFSVSGIAGTLNGDAGDDSFTVITGGSVATINGGTHVTTLGDTLTLPANADISIGSGLGVGVTNIEGVVSTNGRLRARDRFNTTWDISGTDIGIAADDGGQSLSFNGFSYLYGSDGDDIFNITGNGSLSGQIIAGDGNNSLNVDLSPGRLSGQVYYVGGINTDTVMMTGTSNTVVYSSALSVIIDNIGNTFDRLAYTGNNAITNTFSAHYTAASVETVTDRVVANRLEVNGTSGVDTIALGNATLNATPYSTFSVNGRRTVHFIDKLNVIVGGGQTNSNQTDTINLTDNFLTATNNLTLRNAATLTQTAGTLTAAELTLDSIASVPALNTDIAGLSVLNSGAVLVNEVSGLQLNQITTSAPLTVVAGGNITDNDTVQRNISGALALTATGDILLNAQNQNYLSGPLTLTGATVNINNSVATHFGAVNAASLTVNSAGDITQTGAIVAPIANLTAAGSSITLDHPGNDFSNLTINAAAVSVTDLNRIDSGSITAASVTLNTDTGVGTAGAPLATTTSNLTVNNNTGGVYASNTGAATVRITTLGDIGFSNNGNLTIDRLYSGGNGFLDRSQYRNVALNVTNGSVQGIQGIPNRSIYDTPDITAFELTAFISGGGGFGTSLRPISISVVDTFSYLGGRGYVHYFGARPPNIFGADDLITFSALDALSGLQLLEVESLDEFDPAIFTEVRNYYYEDVAIMMPADQRLDGSDDDEKEEEKEGKL